MTITVSAGCQNCLNHTIYKVKRTVQPMTDSKICSFGRWIQDQSWSEVFGEVDVQAKADAFYQIVNESITTIFPTKVVQLHPNDKPWMSDDIKKLIVQRQKAFADNDKPRRVKLRNQIIRKIRKAKLIHNANKVRKLQNMDPGRWHREIRRFANMKQVEPSIHVQGLVPSDHVAVANAINCHLASFPNSQQPLCLGDLPAYLPSPEPPPRVQS